MRSVSDQFFPKKTYKLSAKPEKQIIVIIFRIKHKHTFHMQVLPFEICRQVCKIRSTKDLRCLYV